MTTELSYDHIDLRINGHRVSGYSDAEPAIEFPAITLVRTKWGNDGRLYVTNTSIKGGQLMLKLLPTSNTAKQILRWFQQRQRGARLEFAGSYGDPELEYNVQLIAGKLEEADPAIVPDKDYEATFIFEKILPDFDAARFEPA